MISFKFNKKLLFIISHKKEKKIDKIPKNFFNLSCTYLIMLLFYFFHNTYF
jgi:hypothetical protein